MSKSLEDLALRKQLLQAHSTLCRLRIRHEVNAMRGPLNWARAGVMVASALPVRATLLGLALSGVPHGRLARAVAMAARILLFAKLAAFAVNLLRKPSAPQPPVLLTAD